MRPINGMFSYRFRHNIKTSFGEYLPLLKNSAFTRLLTAGFISAMGSKITYFALLRKVYVISGGSILDLGFLTMASMLPAVIIGPFAGILIDNLPLSYLLFSLSGAIGAAFNIIVFSILQEEVADKNRGKIFALLGIINGPLATLSVFIGTTGAQYLTARVILLLSAAFEVVISFGLRLTKTYRQSNTPEIPPAA